MSSPLVVLTPGGTGLRGTTQQARESTTDVHAFLGVPYAQPPIGNLRFRPPKQLKLWTGIRDATKFGPASVQSLKRVRASYGHLPNLPKEYSEDCLYLNVWTPRCTTNPGQRLPVLVWIHGGAFVQGFSNIYDGTSLAAHENVVVVSINYRLGVFGFIRSGSDINDYHGNMGLLDQLEALRWIQKYIVNFGGDPNNVTVFGESAGGESVSFLILSPLSRHLFHRVIAQSGNSVAHNNVWTKQNVEKFFWKRIHGLGFHGKDAVELTKFLESKTPEELVAGFDEWFLPVVADGETIPDQPLACYKSGVIQPVDCMIGFNSSEGVGFVPPQIADSDLAKETVKKIFSKGFFRGDHPAVIRKVTELAVAEYVTGQDNLTKALSDLYGDLAFVAPAIIQSQQHSKRAKTYVYLFDHRPFYSQRAQWVRADHGDEIPYVFGFPFLRYIPDVWPDEEKHLSKRIMKLWANFARTGNPNTPDGPLWPQYSEGTPYYLPIQTTSSEHKNVNSLTPERIHLWNNVVPELISSYSKAKY